MTSNQAASRDDQIDSRLSPALCSQVELYCKMVVDTPMRGNYVKPRRMRDDELLLDVLDKNMIGQVRARRIRYALDRAEYAKQWGDGTYRIDPEYFTTK